MAAFPDLLKADRERRGFTVGQAAWRVGLKPAVYRDLEAGTRSPTFETWDAICKLFGWPQTFATGEAVSPTVSPRGPEDGATRHHEPR